MIAAHILGVGFGGGGGGGLEITICDKTDFPAEVNCNNCKWRVIISWQEESGDYTVKHRA